MTHVSSPPFFRYPYPLHFEHVSLPVPSHPLQLQADGRCVRLRRKDGTCHLCSEAACGAAHSCEKKNSFDSLYIWKPVTAATSCRTGHAPQPGALSLSESYRKRQHELQIHTTGSEVLLEPTSRSLRRIIAPPSRLRLRCCLPSLQMTQGRLFR